MKKKITIREIATIAGVSVSTVSNILNGRDNKVNKDNKNRIIAIMKENNFEPDFTARCLSIGRSKLIGMIMPIDSTKEAANENPFYFEFMLGVEKTVIKNGYDLVISGAMKENEYRNFITKRKLDGIILVGGFHIEPYSEIDESGIPAVSIDNYQNKIKNSINIQSDNYKGGYLAGKYLAENGHKKIIFVTGRLDLEGVCRERLRGFREALEFYGIKIEENNIIEEEVSYDGGIRAGQKILNMQENSISAVFATADAVAFGIMRSLLEGGKKIPDQISIIGFDDIGTCRYITPELTTIRQNIFNKGEISALELIKMIENGRDDKEDLIIDVELVERKSVLNIKGI